MGGSLEWNEDTKALSERSMYNSLSDSYRLPIEILVEIFAYCVEDGRTDPDTYAKPRWLSLTYVCRRWRAAALNTPVLWTWPHFSHGELALEMIKRSNNLPLVIEAHISRSNGRDVRKAVVQATNEVPRTTRLQLQVSSGLVMLRILANCSQPAPMLTSLNLHIPSGSRAQCTLPSNFLAGTAPNLTHLSLTACHITPDSPLLKNITVLKLNLQDCFPFPTLTGCKAILIASRNLEHLELRLRKVNGDPVLPDQHNPYPLLALRYFYLECDLQACANLISMYSGSFFPTIIGFDSLSHLLPTFLSGTSFTSFFIEGYDKYWVQFKGWTSLIGEENDVPLSTVSSRPRLCLSLRDASPYSGHHVRWDLVIYGLVSRGLPLLTLKSLSFQLGGEVFHNRSDTILGFFASLPNLTIIEITDNIAESIIDALKYERMLDRVPLSPFHFQPLSLQTDSQVDAVQIPPTNNLAFSKLRVIRLDSVELTDAILVSNFTTVLGIRKKCGIGIETLQFFDCDVSDEAISCIETFVGKMESISQGT
ncbi:hypothetical protein E1B28_009349 [Marasmius oreades]|uniref:F-box domain-containing protein n=1 Tax=Marasmius oreades TaxID=181124 RepID=A0A9P7S0F3_9AGAR|nr:uncharacterized protein E1B28_009349 [Marasmius oreades]KAG7093057.1 hypothetical protein E1B28_009349 [Marasmius oreades]